MSSPTFAELGLAEPILHALRARKYEQPTPIQVAAIPTLLRGRDLLGIAQTGTGKTAAFALPILQLLAENAKRPVPKSPRALILTPTRELAQQIAENFQGYGQNLSVRHTIVHGGVGQEPQVKRLRRGVDILTATPGRLMDLMQQGHIDLFRVEVFVLDEADRMLDMGFIDDIRTIMEELPKDRQSLLFSATMPDPIAKLAQTMLRQPKRLEVTPQATTADRVEQTLYLVEKGDKRDLLQELLKDGKMKRVLVFTRTRHMANRVAQRLSRHGVHSLAIHGDKSQNARDRALAAFRAGDARVLVATDVAARGIDVAGITHVVNFDLPNVAENYVHRIGRTARAGETGTAISFCGEEDREFLRDIETLIGTTLPIVPQHPHRSKVPFSRKPVDPKHKPPGTKPDPQDFRPGHWRRDRPSRSSSGPRGRGGGRKPGSGGGRSGGGSRRRPR